MVIILVNQPNIDTSAGANGSGYVRGGGAGFDTNASDSGRGQSNRIFSIYTTGRSFTNGEGGNSAQHWYRYNFSSLIVEVLEAVVEQVLILEEVEVD